MSDRKRLRAFMFCIGMALVLFVSSAYIVYEAEHDCLGEGCDICEHIAESIALLNGFTLLFVMWFSRLAVRFRFNADAIVPERAVCLSPTLVGWKVRLDN